MPKKKPGPKPLPPGVKKELQAFKLRPSHIKYIKGKVESGDYNNKSHVVDSALELMIQLEP